MAKSKKKEKMLEPEFYLSATNIQTINYKVYYMKFYEKIIYFIIGFVVGAIVGYLFYGGIGKDDLGQPTTITYVLDTIISLTIGIFAGKFYLPIRLKQIIKKRKKQLNKQFRDLLESLTTSLSAGKNIVDSFRSAHEDLGTQYESGSYILKELEIIISGIENNFDIEDMLYDFGVRSDNSDIMSFANVFKISYRKGSNMKDIIRETHDILNDKMEIAEEIETTVTATKTEQNLMTVMPVVLVGMMKLLGSDFSNNFVTTTGIISTTVGIGCFVAAYFVAKEVLAIKI